MGCSKEVVRKTGKGNEFVSSESSDTGTATRNRTDNHNRQKSERLRKTQYPRSRRTSPRESGDRPGERERSHAPP